MSIVCIILAAIASVIIIFFLSSEIDGSSSLPIISSISSSDISSELSSFLPVSFKRSMYISAEKLRSFFLTTASFLEPETEYAISVESFTFSLKIFIISLLALTGSAAILPYRGAISFACLKS